ncbi:MAG: thiamine pyrophosphate-dependent enzyme [Burkholderiaceae bacterium]
MPDASPLLQAYARMSRIRRFEEKLLELSTGSAPVVAGSVHLCAGQEAIPVGTAAALRPTDRIVATYRGHGWALEAGVPLDMLMAEVMHRQTGTNGGRGGSAYLSAPQHRFIGENSIVGAGGPIACGVAMAAQLRGQDHVVAVSFGDGALSQGALHEAFVFAAARSLPVIFICENNGWSELTPTSRIARVERLARRAIGYGMENTTVDGCDPIAVQAAVAAAAARARAGAGPTLLECRTIRLWGHYNRDIQHYRPKADRDAASLRDPLTLARAQLDAPACDALDRQASDEVQTALELAQAAPLPDTASAAEHVLAPSVGRQLEQPPSTEELSYGKAINAALHDDMSADPRVVVYGEDVGHAGGIFGVTRDLQKKFGEQRVFDTPIAESAILGSAVGAAIEGIKPVVEIMWADFMLVAFDSLANQAANVRYLSRGTLGAPMVIRTQQGATPGSCAQHSQSLEALLAHIPGLKLGLPATPQDAYAMLRAAIHDPDPVVLIEARSLYMNSGAVQRSGNVEAAAGARLRREGSDVLIISWGAMVHEALAAAELLADSGSSAAVLDLRWLCPLDMNAIVKQARACGRVMIVHEANQTGGFGAEIAARIHEECGDALKAPVVRLGTPDVRMPASPLLQQTLLPGRQRIAALVREKLSAAAARAAA